MTALHRVKAYFGMVPADELDAYDGYGDHDPYGDRPARAGDRYDGYVGERAARRRHESDRYDADRYESDRFEERYDSYDDRYEADRSDRYERRAVPERERALSDDRVRTPRPRDPESEGRAERDLPRLAADDRASSGDRDEEADVSVRSSARGRSWEQNTGPNHTSRSRSGALAAVGSASSGTGSSPTGSLSGSLAAGGSGTEALRASGAAALALSEEPVRPVRAVEAAPAKSVDTPAVPEITTLRPTSYNEARVIGERYRDGIPVIMNLTEMDDAAAKRLVDFAAGLAFALRGSIEKVTNRVFLLSPPNVEVSATERRKFAETS
ncbi:hypothetical protein GCM10023201_18220 [Actinomycetospora corticicola]|uniref:Cell division protein SepF n=1 Tax=Actinomycetospora corticicola TaxID=663602 RepID=A0A7Y9DUM5_9PSEU|nr:cell division inhibitor SepF [Actinomycetospora corticicola]